MTLDEIKNMDPEEHKVKEEHPFNYRYPRGEVILVIFYIKLGSTEEAGTRKFFQGNYNFIFYEKYSVCLDDTEYSFVE